MNKISIKLKVSLWYTLIITVISIIALFAVMTASEKILISDAESKLVRSVDNFVNIPERKPEDRFPDKGHRNFEEMPQFRFFEKGVHTAVFDSEHSIIAGMLPFEFAGEIEFCDRELKEKKYNGDKFLTYAVKSNDENNNDVWVVGVISIADESSMLHSVVKTNLILILTLILVAGLGGYMIINHAFKPVEKIRGTAKAISESSDLSQRISLGNGKDEIYRLAYTFDEMLNKIEKTLENEKQFTSDASHELRTPVAVINSECEYVIDCADSLEEAKESAVSIKRQSDKMAKLIDELLTISRMDRNTQKMNFEDIDISELLNFVCDEQVEIHEKSTQLIRSIPPGIHAKADHILLARLFINLISNAYQYGGGKIVVALEENRDNVIFTVSDNGIGISEENLPKIWERFYQVNPARTNENGSMGLGLAMVKQIAERHGGNVKVNSKPENGTVFTFIMPKN